MAAYKAFLQCAPLRFLVKGEDHIAIIDIFMAQTKRQPA
jgi:hypothetical protein